MSSTVWLRIAGLAVLLTSTLIYTHNGHSWLLFIILLFAPDISIVGYLQNNRTGAILYNLFHTYSLPLLLGIAAFILGDRKSTRLNSSHVAISYAVFCLKKKTQ